MDAFANLTARLAGYTPIGAFNMKYVSKEDYDTFCKEYLFDQLKDIEFGVAFCKRFDIIDYVLLTASSLFAKRHIKDVGYIIET